MVSRIEQLIAEIEEFIDGCKLQPFSSTKIIVDKAQLEELLVELRNRTPDEIKKYQKILNNKDAIINDAKAQAEAIITAANVQTEEMVNQNEITVKAYERARAIDEEANKQAQALIDRASEEANAIRANAYTYTDDLLRKAQMSIEGINATLKESCGSLLSGLEEGIETLRRNRSELADSANAADETDFSAESAEE